MEEKVQNWCGLSAIPGFHIASIGTDKTFEIDEVRQDLRPGDQVRYFPDQIFRDPDADKPTIIFVPIEPLDQPGHRYPVPLFMLNLDRNQAAELTNQFHIAESSLVKFSLVPTGEENAEEEIELFLPD